MEENGKDVLIEEIDKELRTIDAKLKKVISKTDALLKEASNQTEEGQDPKDSENAGDAED
jgi:hypothetical protein